VMLESNRSKHLRILLGNTSRKDQPKEKMYERMAVY
jgi:hypothetical protein